MGTNGIRPNATPQAVAMIVSDCTKTAVTVLVQLLPMGAVGYGQRQGAESLALGESPWWPRKGNPLSYPQHLGAPTRASCRPPSAP